MSGPTPSYSNPPIEPDFYQPKRFVISNISSQGLNTLVTTSLDHDFVIGQLVRILVPQSYGMYQINNVDAYVIEVPETTQVLLDFDSRFFNPFIQSPTVQARDSTPPQIIPVGEINSGAINSSGRIQNGTYIPGSFINISPF